MKISGLSVENIYSIHAIQNGRHNAYENDVFDITADDTNERCPASPITIPAKTTSRSNSQVKSPKPRRQRTTSTSQNTNQNEAIMRANNRTIYTAGRPPWYNVSGQQVEPFVIGICGGSASGKTTVAQKIIESLDVPWVTLLSMDCFYKILNEKQHDQATRNEYNFDHPDAFDIELMADVLRKLKEGRKVEVPIYNFVTHSREPHTVIRTFTTMVKLC